MTSLALVACLLATAAFAAVTVTAFAAVAAFPAMAAFATSFAFAVAALVAATGFPVVAATIAAMAATAFAFACFAFATGFAFAARAAFFTRAFIDEAVAVAVHARRFVLTETGAARSISSTDARQRKRAAGTDHKESSGKHRCQPLPYERPLGCRGAGSAGRAHRPQLHSVERERIECGALTSKHVGHVLKVVGERLVFV
jgi:hypothetical protein